MARLKQIPEHLLAKLWQERASRQRSLRTSDGRRFRVIYPGRVGTTAEPDFRDAVLLEEGLGLVRGDVEIHVNQRDWYAHGHGDYPRYNGVVLHAVAGMDAGSTTLHNGKKVPVLALDSLIDTAPQPPGETGLWPLLKSHGYPPPRSAAEMGEALDDAGDKRFLLRSLTFRHFLCEESPEQVLDSAIMEALGYSQNREPFLELAARVTYSCLENLALGLPARERVGVIQALLLTAAGFLPARSDWSGHHVGPGGNVPSGTMTLARWHLFRIRPQNHPIQRIVGFARLVEHFLPSALDQPTELPPGARRGLVDGLSEDAAGLCAA